jgi:hypothetical protein
MTEKPDSGDIVDRALSELRATAGPDGPPRDVMERIRFQIAERAAKVPICRVPSPVSDDRIAWLPLAAAVLLMSITGWVFAFHNTLFGQIAGEQISADGTIHRFYADGTVKIDTRSGLLNHPGLDNE